MTRPLEHLLDIASLSEDRVKSVLATAHEIKANPDRYRTACEGRLLVNLFYEPSTRTRFSFEIAGRRLGMDVINFTAAGSSVVKGETLLDSFKTLEAMEPDAVVVRHPDDGSVAELAAASNPGTHIINAGDGSHAHPSQAMLDALTLQQNFKDLSRVKILIAGDLSHSRVTKSDIEIFKKLGVGEIRLAAPAQLQPEARNSEGALVFDRMDEAIDGVNVVMMLRIQHERLSGEMLPGSDAYHKEWGLSSERLGQAAPGCLVMHPGPMNRGVEISSEVADGPRSLILQQVNNGVFARMAILHEMLT
ncbi:MAG: aspartate carbamoyltransferase catalytic subunit [Xanthomonadales bacterium]|nr:aspartate carbamoyltransferase catalytic subunit [Xanthomonadales bacterium]NIQ97309.1 aspartate carbamoyltransferase catalytic subunit [Desulfuromonadales bacterium]NIX12160.1 aspartate carbamoyltransferase catalytic subunit [Xanthomonadales bacterium]